MQVSIAEAQKQLSKLLRAVEDGDTVTICRSGKPVVDMVRSSAPPEPVRLKKGKRKFGTLKGRIIELDPDWWKSD